MIRCYYHRDSFQRLAALPIKNLQLSIPRRESGDSVIKILSSPNSFPRLEKIVLLGTEEDLQMFEKGSDGVLRSCCDGRGITLSMDSRVSFFLIVNLVPSGTNFKQTPFGCAVAWKFS